MVDYDDLFGLMTGILRKPGATKALEDLTAEEHTKLVGRGTGKKLAESSLKLVKAMVFSAASGAAVGALSGGNLDAVKEGAYFGAALGSATTVLTNLITYLSYVSGASRTRGMTQAEKSARLKEDIETKIKAQLFTAEHPVVSIALGISYTGLLAITYFALNFIAGSVGTGERILGLFSLNGPKAFWTGFGSGTLYAIPKFRTDAAVYECFERKLMEKVQ